MRVLFVVSLLAAMCPVMAMAQSQAAPAAASPPPTAVPSPAPAAASAAPSATPHRGGDVTRDDYIEHAKRNAERRFDRMDADHNGVLTADERRAYREVHHRRRAAAPH